MQRNLIHFVILHLKKNIHLDNKAYYTDFCKYNNDIPLFHQPWWWEIMTSGNWDIAISKDKNNNIRAVFPYHIRKKFGLKFLLQPVLTPYGGILYFYPHDLKKQTSVYSFQNKHAENIINQLPGDTIYQYFKFSPAIENWYPFFKKNYEQTTRYTFILKNISDHDTLLKGFSNTLKRQIKEAENNFEICEEENVCPVFSLMKKSLARQNIKFEPDRNQIKKLDAKLAENKQRKIFIARDRAGKLISGLYLVWDKNTAYLLGLGSDFEASVGHSTKLLIWESIKFASRHVDIYDFEGSMIEGVERLYKNFGGTKTPYFEIKKYKNRFIKAAFSLLNK